MKQINAARSLLAFSLGAVIGLQPAGAQDKNRYGQYFCYAERAAGFSQQANGSTFSGRISLEPTDAKFVLTLRAVDHTQNDVATCGKSMELYASTLAAERRLSTRDDLDSRLVGTRDFERECLAGDEIAIPNKTRPGSPWTYRSTDGTTFRGFMVSDWLALYTGGTFVRSFPYDSGPVLMEGRCERIEPAK